MNSENDDTDDINNDILWFETEAAAFIGAPASGSTAGLPARVVERIRRRAKPDRLIENVIFGFFRNGVRVAFYFASATQPRSPSACLGAEIAAPGLSKGLAFRPICPRLALRQMRPRRSTYPAVSRDLRNGEQQ